MDHPQTKLLLAAIEGKNLTEAKAVLSTMLDRVQQKDMLLIQEVTQPVVITELHTKLIENFGVNRRAMMLKSRVPGRDRRALLFVRAMQNGLSRVPE
jgi:hypothetical protein